MKDLYYIKDNLNNVGRIVPLFQKQLNVIETNEVQKNRIYLTANPWQYDIKYKELFLAEKFIHFEKPYLFNKTSNDFRLSFCNLQDPNIFDCNDSKLSKFNIKVEPWKKTGDYILIIAPNEPACRYYTGLSPIDWVMNVKNDLRKYTDRKIFYRFKENKKVRINDPLSLYLNDSWAIITLQSVACIESICKGVPVFNLAPACCDNMALQDISKIETPFYPENRWEWLKSLSFSQFTHEEIANGKAMSILKDRYSI